MATKLDSFHQIIEDLGSVFPKLTAHQEIYLTPKIMPVNQMATLEIQVCEGESRYEDIEGGCRSEDFSVLVGIFRKYRLDSDGRHAKALSDLNTSIFLLKESIIAKLDGNFLNVKELLTRPLIVRNESAVTDAGEGQLLKVISFIAGINSVMGT